MLPHFFPRHMWISLGKPYALCVTWWSSFVWQSAAATHTHTRAHFPTPGATLSTHAASKAGGNAGPGEEKMEYGSSLSVSGWQGFSPTPSHSSNEVIKWMNEPWKETCCWGRCVPKMPLPTPQPFASLYYCGLRTVGGKSSQEDEAISAMCLQHIYQSWVACTQAAVWYMPVTVVP